MNSEIAAPVKGPRESRERRLRPAVGFRHPMAVVKDPDLDLADKRAISSSWASDACTVVGRPELRWSVASEVPVLVRDGLQALRRLDGFIPVVNGWGRAMTSPKSNASLKVVASLLALAIAAQSVPAQAVPTAGNPPSVSPPSGQYAPPPSGAEASGSTYDDKARRDDRAYADQYSRWAARYCVDKRANTAAGAAVGASSTPGSACPPGYIVAPGAPAFYYDGPVFAYDTVYCPAWRQPWVWVDGHWVYQYRRW